MCINTIIYNLFKFGSFDYKNIKFEHFYNLFRYNRILMLKFKLLFKQFLIQLKFNKYLNIKLLYNYEIQKISLQRKKITKNAKKYLNFKFV